MNTYEDLHETLGDLFDEIGPDSPAEVDEILREAGFDPDQVSAYFQKVAMHALDAALERQKEKARLDRAQALSKLQGAQKVIPDDRVGRITMLEHLLLQIKTMGVGLPVGVEFRNYEKMSDEDLASLLEELQYLIGTQGLSGKGGE